MKKNDKGYENRTLLFKFAPNLSLARSIFFAMLIHHINTNFPFSNTWRPCYWRYFWKSILNHITCMLRFKNFILTNHPKRIPFSYIIYDHSSIKPLSNNWFTYYEETSHSIWKWEMWYLVFTWVFFLINEAGFVEYFDESMSPTNHFSSAMLFLNDQKKNESEHLIIHKNIKGVFSKRRNFIII